MNPPVMPLSEAREPPDPPAWRRWSPAVGLLVVVVLGYVAFVLRRPIPLLDSFDLGIHELGHLLAQPFGRVIMLLAGSVAQVAVPSGLAAYFALARREMAAAGFLSAWAGTSARDVSVYIQDAPYRALPLLGGEASMHDWGNLLGPGIWDALDRAHVIAAAVSNAGLFLVVVGAILCVWEYASPWVAVRLERQRVERLEARRATLPVHEPRTAMRHDEREVPPLGEVPWSDGPGDARAE